MSYSQNLKNGKVVKKDFTALTGTQTAELDLEGGTLVAIRTPASLASTVLTIQNAESSGGTFIGLFNKSNAEYTITTDGTSKQHFIEPSISAGLRYIKITADQSETTKTFTALIRNID